MNSPKLIYQKKMFMDDYDSDSIRQFKLEMGEKNVTINLKIKGMWSNNYKLYVEDNKLKLYALRWIRNGSRTKRYPASKFTTTTSSIYLPCEVDHSGLESYIRKGVLKVVIPRRGCANKTKKHLYRTNNLRCIENNVLCEAV